MFRSRQLPLAALTIACVVASTDSRELLTWSQTTFEDFRKGHFEDAGANSYVSRRGRAQLINKWDLNDDGALDVVFANSHSHAEKLDATIYWGNSEDFDDRRSSALPSDGAQRTVAGDLDGDGRTDLVIPNYANGTWDGMDSYVYAGDWGALRKAGLGPGAEVAPFIRKTSLPTRAAQAAAVGDLNGDGHADVVFAMSAGFWEYRAGGARGTAYQSPSRIYWGSPAGFDRARFTDLEAFGASDAAIADLNQDGLPDLVLANRERQGTFDLPSFIYWGGKNGFSAATRTELPTNQVNDVEVADVNRDGYPEIVFANGRGAASYVYLNDRGRFDPERRVELPSSDARGCAAGDLNGDGFVDLFLTNHQVAGNPMTLSFLYWGGEDGFSRERRQPFQTTGAWGVSLADLNKDRRPELVVSSYSEHYSYDVASHIYWNSPRGFSDSLRTSVFTHGAVGNTTGDFDGDGHVDVIFNNTIAGTRGLGSGSVQVYWGDQQGRFSTDRLTELPALDPYEWASGDLDDDGWPDLIVANMDEVGRRLTENFVFWGAADGFRAERRTALISPATCGVSVADLDRDGYLDVIFSTRDQDPTLGILIYWGAPGGFVTTDRTGLRNYGSGAPTIADLNNDGHLDLVAHSNSADHTALIYWGDGSRRYTPARSSPIPDSFGASNSEAADLNRDGALDLILTRSVWQEDRRARSFVYYGNAGGDFTVDRRQEFETVGTQVVTVGDVNRDGWLDVVCPNYNNNQSRATLSRVYLGSAGGFTADRMFELPTSSGTGSQIADYNRDGYNDLLLICHRSEGDPGRVGAFGRHRTDSFLYWGGPGGFEARKRLPIPSKGAHYDSGVDLGNIFDRRFEFGYVSDAFYFQGRSGHRIDWTARQPHGSRVRFQIRTAVTRESLGRAPWTGPAGPGSFYERGGTRLRVNTADSWVQYRAVLVTPNGSVSPVLEQVRLSFR